MEEIIVVLWCYDSGGDLASSHLEAKFSRGVFDTGGGAKFHLLLMSFYFRSEFGNLEFL